MLISVAAAGVRASGLSSVGDIANALAPVFGGAQGKIVFTLGVLGASLTSIIVCSVTMA